VSNYAKDVKNRSVAVFYIILSSCVFAPIPSHFQVHVTLFVSTNEVRTHVFQMTFWSLWC